MFTPTVRRGTRRPTWPISCPRPVSTSALLASGRLTSKVLMWMMIEVLRQLLGLGLGSKSRFTKWCGFLTGGDALDARVLLATIRRWQPSDRRLAYRCSELLEEQLLRFRECTCLTSSRALERSRGAHDAEPTAQIAALRCGKVAEAPVRRTPDSNVFASWSAAATRFPKLGCWMHPSQCKFCWCNMLFLCWH